MIIQPDLILYHGQKRFMLGFFRVGLRQKLKAVWVQKPKEKKYIFSSNYYKIFLDIQRRCDFQISFSKFLLSLFFVLQYTIPIFLAAIGGITAGNDLLVSFLQEFFTADQAENIVKFFIFFISVLGTLFGTISATTNPSESYDNAAAFHNKFSEFKINLAIDMRNLELTNAMEEEYLQLLKEKNANLSELIEEYNQKRSIDKNPVGGDN
ncbi:hypothetical protein [Moorena sp. SIO3H5]|uniref:hypothetical protein n=1 Tax=Moorena sp. SIO3H5 TaxID=2607834 RepID=UPI0013BD0D35|nr:hypothetical protein [Moorena sp. SIO3H5]NEO69307.1 hypothetical protein [Moorena sp. SIO3H5]